MSFTSRYIWLLYISRCWHCRDGKWPSVFHPSLFIITSLFHPCCSHSSAPCIQRWWTLSFSSTHTGSSQQMWYQYILHTNIRFSRFIDVGYEWILHLVLSTTCHKCSNFLLHSFVQLSVNPSHLSCCKKLLASSPFVMSYRRSSSQWWGREWTRRFSLRKTCSTRAGFTLLRRHFRGGILTRDIPLCVAQSPGSANVLFVRLLAANPALSLPSAHVLLERGLVRAGEGRSSIHLSLCILSSAASSGWCRVYSAGFVFTRDPRVDFVRHFLTPTHSPRPLFTPLKCSLFYVVLCQRNILGLSLKHSLDMHSSIQAPVLAVLYVLSLLFSNLLI